MTFAALYLLFPVVLAVHNLDEFSRYDDFVRTYHNRFFRKLIARRIVRDAMLLLTLTAAVLAVLTWVSRKPVLLTIAKVVIFALMLNGIGHCILSLKRRAWTAGTRSAVALVLPYSALAIVVMRRDLGDSASSLFNSLALGALAMPLAVLTFLFLGYGLSQLATRAGIAPHR